MNNGGLPMQRMGQQQGGQQQFRQMNQPNGQPFGWGGQVATNPQNGWTYPAMYAPQQTGFNPMAGMEYRANRFGNGGNGMFGGQRQQQQQRPQPQQQPQMNLQQLMALMFGGGGMQRPQPRQEQFVDPVTGEVGR